jgi:hypothetical protein
MQQQTERSVLAINNFQHMYFVNKVLQKFGDSRTLRTATSNKPKLNLGDFFSYFASIFGRQKRTLPCLAQKLCASKNLGTEIYPQLFHVH